MNKNKMPPPLSHVYSELWKRYKNEGLEILGGFSPYITGISSSSGNLSCLGNYVANENTLLSTSAGIANDEATFIYGLCEIVCPKKILIIGNSYGFSTVFLALTCPDSKLIAFDKYRTEGIKATNSMLAGLTNKEVIQASTPDDIPSIIENKLDGEVDFVLIDAVHTNDMQTAEFQIIDKYLSPKSTVVFHDVLSCGLLPSLHFLQNNYIEYDFRIINKSSTGIAVCIKGDKCETLDNFLSYFSIGSEKVLAFNTLIMKNINGSAVELFSKSQYRFQYQFMPHPQL